MKHILQIIKNTNGRDIWCATMVVWSVDIWIGQSAAALQIKMSNNQTTEKWTDDT